MKRRFFKLVVFLLLGAIVNVAVAWGCALFVEIGWINDANNIGGTANPPNRFHPFIFWHRVGTTRLLYAPENAFEVYKHGNGTDLAKVPYWSSKDVDRLALDEGIILEGRGWPCRALLCRFELSESEGAFLPIDSIFVRSHNYTFPNGPETAPPPFVLPLIPIWPGFASNTMFYAVILWLLWSSPFAAKRLIRRKRGRCIKCAYDLRGNFEDGCPECGWRRKVGNNNMN